MMNLFKSRKIKGAVSIFLIMILIPTLLFSSILIDGSRLMSAKAMTQEAADLALASVLASYNLELKEQYGLFAIKDKDKVEDIFRESLEATLMTSGLGDDEDYVNKIWEIFKSSVGAENPYIGAEFFNLYDFQISDTKVTPLYSLANEPVLENQIVEYSKYRGAFVVAERMNILGDLGKLKEEAEKNAEASEAMEDKMGVDERNAEVENAFNKLRSNISDFVEAKNVLLGKRDKYINCLKQEMNDVQQKYADGEVQEGDKVTPSRATQNAAAEYKQALKDVSTAAGKLYKQAELTKKAVENAMKRLDDFDNRNNAKSSNETIGDLIGTSKSEKHQYEKEYLPLLDDFLNNDILIKLMNDAALPEQAGTLSSDIQSAIYKYEDEIEWPSASEDDDDDGEEEDEESIEYFFYYLSGNEKYSDINSVLNGSSKTRCYEAAVKALSAYFDSLTYDAGNDGKYNPTLKLNKNGNDSNQLSQFSKNTSENKTEDKPTNLGKIPDDIFNSRPSHTFSSDKGAENNTNFYNEKDLSTSKKMVSGAGDSFLLQIAEGTRDDILGLSYMFGTFKTRMTGNERFTKSGMPENDKGFYMPEWRYQSEQGEMNLRFQPKKDQDTVLQSEIEYLVSGWQSDAANENAVYATILAERLANNMIALYGNENVKGICNSAAAAASAATLGTVPPQVFFWIFLTAWSIAESYLEMDYLINKGYKIPAIKTKDNVILSEFPGNDGLIANYGQKGIFVTYEDYLLLLLVIKGESKRLMRTADLIEMNMRAKHNQSDFRMESAFTYLQSDVDISLRYLFSDIGPFQQSYRSNGLSGRMKFNSKLYLGY